MHRTTIVIAAATMMLAACADPNLGGNVANGDHDNHPSQPNDPAVANGRNPTGNQSGPWVGEYGLNDTTTGVNDRLADPAGERTTGNALIPDSSRAPGERIESSDEQSSRVDLPVPDPTIEVR